MSAEPKWVKPTAVEPLWAGLHEQLPGESYATIDGILIGGLIYQDLVERLACAASVNENGCYEWQGLGKSIGYGRIMVLGKLRAVHRVAYELYVGPIKPFHVIRHRCDNPKCFRVDHLEQGTQKENMRDCVERGRHPGRRNLLTKQWRSAR